jgi:hypothetical protein
VGAGDPERHCEMPMWLVVEVERVWSEIGVGLQSYIG